MSLELLLPLLAASLLAGILGRQRRIGFWGFFFASMVFTPVVTLSFLYFAAPVEAAAGIARRTSALRGK
jgi:hypothetical protein